MRELKELLMGRERAWVYLGDDEHVRMFMDRAKAEGWHFPDGSPVGDEQGWYVMGLHCDGTIAYLQIWIWMKLFGTEAAPLCVDFRAFAAGDEDFTAKTRGFTGALTEPDGSVIVC